MKAIPIALILALVSVSGCGQVPPVTKTDKAEAAPAGEQQPEQPSAQARKPERAKWAWNKPQAEITATGDIKWKPEPFKFAPGASVKYIDFDAGKDDNAGTKDAPFKHHPWDTAATGNAKACKGPQTYVFKRGVIYRGELVANESGTPESPIILTSDPAWGNGEAAIYASELVTGWKQGAANKSIPEGDKVWSAELTFQPRNVWEVKAGKAERIPLARTPNWKVSDADDPMSEWWTWEQPEWWTNKWHVDFGGHRSHLGIDKKHLTQNEDYYKGANLRTEYAIVMGTPIPTTVEGYNATEKGVYFQGIWFGDSEQICTNNRYYLEDKPHYLDSAGEQWFERNANGGGTLYIRLPNDADPNKAVIEAGKRITMIESTGLSNVHVSGLSFRFTNTHYDLFQPSWGHKDVRNAAIRIQGQAVNVHVANCKFEHVAKSVRIVNPEGKAKLDDIVIADNDIQFTDHGALDVEDNALPGGDVKVLRNNMYMIGMRPHRQDHGHALCVNFPATMTIAGNVLDRCYGAGIFVFGGKNSGDLRDKPFARNLVYNNKVSSALMAANDWGSIETWQGGPFYVYNNISANPSGYWNWAYNPNNKNARLGMAYYMDGSYKNYNFNNLAIGNSDDPKSKTYCHAAYYEATSTIYNSIFNNTIWRFALGSNWSPGGGRHAMIGNVWMEIGDWVFQHGKLKEDKGPVPPAYPYESMAYGNNVFFKTDKIAIFEAVGEARKDLDAFKKAIEATKTRGNDGGVATDQSPVKDAAARDFRLAAGSAAIDKGVKYFVPWALNGVVGEWNFVRNNADPAVVLDEHWYMAPYLYVRDNYYATPVFNLKAANVKAEDYVDGALEDWAPGALKFNGKDQFASIAHAELIKPYAFETNVNNQKKQVTVEGKDIISPNVNTSNLLIESYFKTDAGASGVIVSKMADNGYQLAVTKTGGATLTLKFADQKFEVASTAKINDGKWHHVIAEVDRATQKGVIYVDGKKSVEAPITLPPSASLENTADLFVAKSTAGEFLSGQIDFLRIARGTLADAKTSIEELYDWEFDGPFLRDFLSHEITGKRRDAGAFEFTEGK